MTREEIKQMVNTCDSYHGCGCCPYSPEDISRFIGDKWKGGCPNYDRKLVYAMGKGYGDVSEYEAEIERLKAENARFENNMKNVLEIEKKQAKIDVLTEVKESIKTAINNYWESNGGGYYLAEDAINDIDEFITEIGGINNDH